VHAEGGKHKASKNPSRDALTEDNIAMPQNPTGNLHQSSPHGSFPHSLLDAGACQDRQLPFLFSSLIAFTVEAIIQKLFPYG